MDPFPPSLLPRNNQQPTNHQLGVNVVVVHGGGPQIAAMLKRLDVQSEFVEVISLFFSKNLPLRFFLHVWIRVCLPIYAQVDRSEICARLRDSGKQSVSSVCPLCLVFVPIPRVQTHIR